MTAEGFRVPTCTCGHAVGQHKSGRSSWPHPMVYGICLVEGCGCTNFVEVKGDQPEQRIRAYEERYRTACCRSCGREIDAEGWCPDYCLSEDNSDVDARIDALSRAAMTPWPPEAA